MTRGLWRHRPAPAAAETRRPPDRSPPSDRHRATVHHHGYQHHRPATGSRPNGEGRSHRADAKSGRGLAGSGVAPPTTVEGRPDRRASPPGQEWPHPPMSVREWSRRPRRHRTHGRVGSRRPTRVVARRGAAAMVWKPRVAYAGRHATREGGVSFGCEASFG
jgi:hypothetical protein